MLAVDRGRGSFLRMAVSAGTRHIMIISGARELGPSGHINGSCIRHEIARHRASDQPHSGTLSWQTGPWLRVTQPLVRTASRQLCLGSTLTAAEKKPSAQKAQTTPLESSDHRLMWLAAAIDAKGEGVFAVLIPLWACFGRSALPGYRTRLAGDTCPALVACMM